MGQLTAWLQQTFGLSPDIQQRLLASAVAAVAIWAIRRIILVLEFPNPRSQS